MHNPLDLRGGRVLVTGAASGIGRATAELCARLGARVVLVDRNAAGLDAALAALEGSGHVRHECDLRELAALPGLVASWAAAGGPLTGMVHAAGLPCLSPVRLLGPDVYRDALLVNVEAAVALTRGFQRAAVVAPDGGSIVFIASVMALVGSAGATGYSLTKAALLGMARSMAVELAPRRIRVNCVAPGFVRTPMLDKVGGNWDAAQAAQVEAMHPLGLGEPEDVANAAAFLLSPAARWMTGSTLTLDGGYTAH